MNEAVHALIHAIQAPAPLSANAALPLTSSSSSSTARIRDARVDCAHSDFSRALAVAGRAGVMAPSSADAYTSLHWAAHCDEPALLRALLQAPCGSADNNGNGGGNESCSASSLPSSVAADELHPDCVRTASGATPLHTACARGCVRAARVLLELRADPCAANRWGENALHAAAGNGHVDVVALLLSGRSNATSIESDASSELQVASSASRTLAVSLPPCAVAVDRWGRTPLRIARENAGAERVTPTIELLIGAGAPDGGAAAHSRGDDSSDDAAQSAGRTDEGATAATPIAHQSVIAEFLAAVVRRNASVEPSSPLELSVESRPQRAAAIAIAATASTLTPSSACSHTPVASAVAAAIPRPPPSASLSKQIEYGVSISSVATLLAASPSREYACGRDSFGMSALLKFAAWDLPEHATLLIRHARASDAAAAALTASASAELCTPMPPPSLPVSAATLAPLPAAPTASLPIAPDSFEFALLTAVDPAGRTALHVAAEEGAWRALQCLLLAINTAHTYVFETIHDGLAAVATNASVAAVTMAVRAFFREARDKKGRSPLQAAAAAWAQQVPSEVATMLQML
jgi:ankyrin repeat protein